MKVLRVQRDGRETLCCTRFVAVRTLDEAAGCQVDVEAPWTDVGTVPVALAHWALRTMVAHEADREALVAALLEGCYEAIQALGMHCPRLAEGLERLAEAVI